VSILTADQILDGARMRAVEEEYELDNFDYLNGFTTGAYFVLVAADERERVLLEALHELVKRCDGEEGVRADGSNIQTIAAHAALERVRG